MLNFIVVFFYIFFFLLQPVPMVQYRKGTRSRPQVKIPKQYHDDYEDVIHQQPPSPPQSEDAEDPLIPIEIIKTEPIDVVENDISSFNVETVEASFAESITSDNPPTLVPQDALNPLESNPLEMEENQQSQSDDGFTRIKLTTEHLDREQIPAEDTVASIQIAECHSMDLDEQEEESRRMDEGFENIVAEVFRTDVEDVIETAPVEDTEKKEKEEEEVEEEKMDVETKDEIMENHVGENVEEQKGDTDTEKNDSGGQ